jgi:hypothetical protein
MRHFTDNRARWLMSMLPGAVIFLSIAHHVIDFWEQHPALMITLMIVFLPIFAVGFFLISKKIASALSQTRGRRVFLYGLAALLIGSVITWRLYHVPSNDQTLTITPVLAEGQTLALAELKANGEVIALEQAALESGWEEAEGVLYADESARPLTISFQCPVNSPVSVLLATSPQSGTADITFEGEHLRADLSSPTEGVDEILFSSTYYGLHGGVFLLLLVLIDLLAFGALLVIALILQDLGQASTLHRSATENRFPSHRAGLALLMGLGVLLHILNALSISLTLGPDSPGYLQGAVHLARFGNLEGVSAFRGPGTTFLFGPVLWLFGRSPWGMKILLHLISLACIPVSYQIGWQLSRNRQVAFCCGLIAILSPDLYFYANYVMSDLPNLFFVLLFCWCLIVGLETAKWQWIMGTMLSASFATLIRSENALLIAIGFVALLVSFLARGRGGTLGKQAVLSLGAASLLAILPIVWWLNYNQRLHGYQSSTDYLGHVIYDGWVHFGNASGFSFTDPNSGAVKTIEQTIMNYPIIVEEPSGVPTGGEIYPSLIEAGYTPEQAFELLKEATLDSIRSNKRLAFEILVLKLETGLEPKPLLDITLALPNEPVRTDEVKPEFFDIESLSIPRLIRLQRWSDLTVNWVYMHLYAIWVIFCLLALSLSLFHKPMLTWAALILIIATRILIPLTLGLPGWRFILSAWIPLQISAIIWIFLFAKGIKVVSQGHHSSQSNQLSPPTL